MYHKISPKNIYLHKYLLWSYCERKCVENAQIPILYKVGFNTLVFNMVADFFRITIRSIIWK